MTRPRRTETPAPQWTNARLTQRRHLTDHLIARIEDYEHGDWTHWDWTDEAEKIMQLLGLLTPQP